MNRFTFRTQMYLGLAILAVCFVLFAATRQGLFTNLGWFIYGALFAVHPVCPKRYSYVDQEQMRRWLRIGGIVVMVLALITRFGV